MYLLTFFLIKEYLFLHYLKTRQTKLLKIKFNSKVDTSFISLWNTYQLHNTSKKIYFELQIQL